MKLDLRCRRLVGLAPIAALGLACAAVGLTALPGAAANPFQAGEVSTSARALTGPDAVVVVARSSRSGAALGLPDASTRTATHVDDRFSQTAYDEVTDLDRAGRATAVQRFAADGRLLAAVRFGGPPSNARTVTNETAVLDRGALLVRDLGLHAFATGLDRPAVRRSADGSWLVSWQRSVAGVPVPGDGLRIELWQDGSVHRLVRSERPLADVPRSIIGAEAARAIGGARLDAWFTGASRAAASVDGLDLAWVAPNDTFAPNAPDAPGAVLRLAWVVHVSVGGALADRVSGLEIAVDAGDGSILGGDLLR